MARVRTGSYRHSFFEPHELRALWPRLEAPIARARTRYEAGEWSAAELTGAVMAEVWRAARGSRWHNGRREKRVGEPAVAAGSPLAIVQDFRWRSIPPAALEILLEWHRAAVPLRLCFDIPNVEAVLADQTAGRRCVSVLIGDPETFFNGADGRDGFSFILHDLLHASHFFENKDHFRRQVFFSRWMLDLLHSGLAARGEAFDYLASDMNTHWVHAMKCLKSILPEEARDRCLDALDRVAGPGAALRVSGLWRKLNTPEENEELRFQVDHVFADFLETGLGGVATPPTFVLARK